MAFDDFGDLFEKRSEARQHFVFETYADERCDLKAYLSGLISAR